MKQQKQSSLFKVLEQFMYSNTIHWLNVILVAVNAIVIGLKTSPAYEHTHMSMLHNLTVLLLYIFAAEIFMKLLLRKERFFNRPGDPFSLVVIGSAIVLHVPELTVLLAFNILRAYRMLNFAPRTRQVLDSLTNALPGIFNLILIICLSFAIFAILGTYLFKAKLPEKFGSISNALLTLSQIMVGDDWGNLIHKMIEAYPYGWIFLVSFLILITYGFLNTFIAIIVSAISQQFDKGQSQTQSKVVEAKTNISKAKPRVLKSKPKALKKKKGKK